MHPIENKGTDANQRNVEKIRRGLALGKYAPFHRGHQHVIETALKEMDEVTVIIYDCPSTTTIPLSVRARWIKRLYPEVQVLEAWNGPEETGYTPKIKKLQEDYVLALLEGKRITHFYSSEPYGEHMSEALGAENRVIDMKRERYPVSGTLVRENPFLQRLFVHPLVYRDLIMNVVFLGAPSTGKTTLTAYMAERFDTVWMPEYGREFWEKHQVERRLTKEQLVELAEGHIQREEEMLQRANRYLFTDTNAVTTFMFGQYYHGEAHPRLTELANQAAARYDFVFVCDADIPYDDTWDRSGDMERQIFQKQIIADLQERRIPFIILEGSLEERAEKVESVLSRLEKFVNIGQWLQWSTNRGRLLLKGDRDS